MLTSHEIITSFALYGIVHAAWKIVNFLSDRSLRIIKSETDHIVHQHVEHRHKQNLQRCRLGLCSKFSFQTSDLHQVPLSDRLLTTKHDS